MSRGNNKLSKKAIAAIIAVVLISGTIGACRDSMKEKSSESETTSTTPVFSFSTTKAETTVTTTEATIEFTTERGIEIEQEAIATESEYDYVVNVNTGKFHYSYCSQADKIKSENKTIIHGTSDELRGMGYSPCGKCKP